MKCSDVRRVLDLLAGGDLEPGEAEGLREHLDSCAECRAAYDSCRRSLDALAVLGISSMDEEIPEAKSPRFWSGLEETVLGRIRRPEPRMVPWLWFGSGFAAAACLLLVFWLSREETAKAPEAPSSAAAPSAPVAGESIRGNLVPVKGPLGPMPVPGAETQGGAVPVKWFPPRLRRLMEKGEGPGEAVPVGYRARF